MQRRDLMAFGAQARHRFFDRTLGAAPTDDQQVARGVAEYRRRFQGLLQRGELVASRANARFVAFRVIGDVAQGVVSKSRQSVYTAGLTRHEAAGQASDRVPV